MSAYDDAMRLVEMLRQNESAGISEAADVLEAYAVMLDWWYRMPGVSYARTAGYGRPVTGETINCIGMVIGKMVSMVEDTIAKNSAAKVTIRQYFCAQEHCPARAKDIDDPDCICWHDAGGGPHPFAFDGDNRHWWRDKPEAQEASKTRIEQPKGMFTTEGKFEPSPGLGYNPDSVSVDMSGIGPIETNAAGEITSITVTALEHLGAESCRTTDATTPKGQDGKAYILPDLNGDIEYVAGPPKLRPMQSAPRDGSWIIVFYESGPADSPLECEVLRFSTELPKPFWLDRYSDACFSDGSDGMLGWLPIPVRE